VLGVVVACAAEFLIGVDGLAIAIALPTLQGDLGAPPIEAQWVLTAYGLAFGGGLLLGGRLGDLYGRRRMLVGGWRCSPSARSWPGPRPRLGCSSRRERSRGSGPRRPSPPRSR
jgi:hypothetical protein